MVVKNAAPAADTLTQTTEVFYPETDGMPLADGDYQFEHFVGLLYMLKAFFRDRTDVAVKGNTMLYYVEGNPYRWLSPDCYVAFGVDLALLRENNTYRVWDMGKPPDFVLEIGSPGTWRKDLVEKRDLYASMGIGEYWMFDPSGGEHYGFPLRGERLVDGQYWPLEMREGADGGVWGHSATLNLEFHWEDGSLRLYDPVGGCWLENDEEAAEARLAAEARAEFAEARAESAESRVEFAESRAESAETRVENERLARESAESRVAELEAELRRMRGQG